MNKTDENMDNEYGVAVGRVIQCFKSSNTNCFLAKIAILAGSLYARVEIFLNKIKLF